MLQLPIVEKSLWRESYPDTPLYPPLERDLEVDVVIVGAGVSGLSTAYFLKRKGLRVAVLEKDTVGGGTTGRTTGKVTSQHNLIYDELRQHAGMETARLYGQANQTALAEVDVIIRREKIDCDWQRDDNYVYTTHAQQVAALRQEADVARSLGLPATFETTTDLPFEVKGAVRFAKQGKFNAEKYLLGLAQVINGNGSHVFEHSNVVRINDGEICRVLAGHYAVKSRAIVIATSVPTLPLAARGAYALYEYPTESYIVAGRLSKPFRGMYISPDSNHYSILPISRGEESWLLVGGESHIFGRRISKEPKYQRLADYAEKYFGIKKISYTWSDRDYLAYDSIPLIGKVYPWSKNLYVATGMMKWGLSSGTVAGLIIRDLILGKNNPWAAVYDSTRLNRIAAIPRAIAKSFS